MAETAVPICLSIASSDSSGGAGIQADLRAFAAAGCYGTTVVVAVTAQNTRGVVAVHDIPVSFVRTQLRAVLGDIRIDAVKTGALRTQSIVAVVRDELRRRRLPLVVDPVMTASAGGELNPPPTIQAIVEMLFPLATVVTPNLAEAEALAGSRGSKHQLAERIAARGAHAVLITGGHGTPVDHLYAGGSHVEIPVMRHTVAATHGTGCTHSATLAAELAKGADVETAARTAAAVTSRAVLHGLEHVGAGEGVADVFGRARRGERED